MMFPSVLIILVIIQKMIGRGIFASRTISRTPTSTSTISSTPLSTTGYVPNNVPPTSRASSTSIIPHVLQPSIVIASSMESSTSRSETPLLPEFLKLNTIQQDDLLSSTSRVSLTREASSFTISPIPALKPETEMPSPVPTLLEEEELLPKSSPAPDMSLMVPSNSKQSSSFGHDSTAMGSMPSETFSSGLSKTLASTPEYNLSRELFNCVHFISSCRGHCGEILDSCSCDIHCEIYNVCCEDFEDVCPAVFEDARKSLGGLLDVKIECVGEFTSYLVIAGCPKNYTSVDIREECEDSKVLINSVDGLHFRNIACLRCHGFTEAQTKKWTMSVYLNHRRDSPISYFGAIDVNQLREMSLWEWEVPKQILNVSRVCSREMVEECPTETDEFITENCSTNNANVLIRTGKGEKIYKNIYCFYCNGESGFFCKGTTRYDYKKTLKVGRFSSIVSMRFDRKSERFELEATKPFVWRKAECTGSFHNLNCFITKCILDIPPANNTCGPQMTETCVWMEFSTSSEASKGDLLYFTNMNDNSSLSRPDMQFEKVKYASDIANRKLKFRLLFTMWTGSFPYTLDDLYDSYSALYGRLLMERSLRGDFSLCFKMIHDTKKCYKLECQLRHYTIPNPSDHSGVGNTIQDPSNQVSVSNGGITLYNRSGDGDKLPVVFCFFLAIVVMCRILEDT